jgi:hypothetical protein
MPNRSNIPYVEVLDNGNYVVNLIGIEVTNVTYPHPDIVGHFIVRAVRDEDNKTILDKGVVFGCVEKELQHEFNWFREQTAPRRVWSFFSPKMLFDKEIVNGQGFRIEGYYPYNRVGGRLIINNAYDTPGLFSGYISLSTWQDVAYGTSMIPNDTGREVVGYADNVLVDNASTQSVFGTFDKNLRNNARTTHTSFYSLNEDNIPIND